MVVVFLLCVVCVGHILDYFEGLDRGVLCGFVVQDLCHLLLMKMFLGKF